MDILQLVRDAGAHKAADIAVQKLDFVPELRELCSSNACGRYGKNYTCPPHIGAVDDLIAAAKSFRRAVIFQNVYGLEDSYDFEGMMSAQRLHNAMTLDIARKVYAALGREAALVLGAGGCMSCERCTLPDGVPCPKPGEAIASLEAYGLRVNSVSEVSDLKYINGVNTVTYFSGVFYDKARKS